eukprot:TRINITY_DN25316_c0_g1_i1.p1 TRINITY_DN25316_c0_g1~~TRINITY_DN25316_c0_g1_i1.p1  ORF type:complete len:640 (+),score=211.29 TRINITY_DN25316_c0_g1_i1:74-1993(+)
MFRQGVTATMRCAPRVLAALLAAAGLFVAAQAADGDALGSFDCSCWAAQGQCASNSAWMLQNCAASCSRNAAFEEYLGGGCKSTCALEADALRKAAEKEKSAFQKELETQRQIATQQQKRCDERNTAAERELGKLRSGRADANSQATKRLVEVEKQLAALQVRLKEVETQKKEAEAKVARLDIERQKAVASAALEQEKAAAAAAEAQAAAARSDSAPGGGDPQQRLAALAKRYAKRDVELLAEQARLKERLERFDAAASARVESLGSVAAARHAAQALVDGRLAAVLSRKESAPQASFTAAWRSLSALSAAATGATAAAGSGAGEALSGLSESSAGILSQVSAAAAQVPAFFQDTLWPVLQASASSISAAFGGASAAAGSALGGVAPAMKGLGELGQGGAGRVGGLLGEAWAAVQRLVSGASGVLAEKAPGLAAQAKALLPASSSSTASWPSAAAAVVVGLGLLLLLRRRIASLLARILRLFFLPCAACSKCRCPRRQSGDDDGEKPTVASMGAANSMYFDKEKGKWRERGKEHLEEEDKPLAPPPTAAALPKKDSGEATPRKEHSALDSLIAPPSNPYRGRTGTRTPPSSTTPRTRTPVASPVVQMTAFGMSPRNASDATPSAAPTAGNSAEDLSTMF